MPHGIETVPAKSRLPRIVARLFVKMYMKPRFGVDSGHEDTRRALDLASRLAIPPRGTRYRKVIANGVPCEWIAGPGVSMESGAVILYLHGGGFCSGSPATHRQMIAGISGASGARALAVDYRLAPEHPYPAANEDCMAAWDWLLAEGVPPEKIVVGGDSAGGALTLMLLLELKARGGDMPAGAFCLSPLTDAAHFDGESYRTRSHCDPWLGPDVAPHHSRRYIPDMDNPPAIVSPVRADLSGLPPLYIQVGDDEVLLSDSTRLAERAAAAGTRVRIEVWEKMWHVFQSFAVILPEAREAIRRLGTFVGRRTG
ncbi:MAG: alpha/beta hydrolase [Desulfatibacillaceae bacterium]